MRMKSFAHSPISLLKHKINLNSKSLEEGEVLGEFGVPAGQGEVNVVDRELADVLRREMLKIRL